MASIDRVIVGFFRLCDPFVPLSFSRLASSYNRRKHHTVVPVDSVCCFCWASAGASKHACVSKHIAFQIDRCHWKTYLLKSKIVLSLKATRVASDDWISISGTQSIIYWNSKSICRNLHLLSALSNLENDSWTNGSKSSKSEYNSGFLPF